MCLILNAINIKKTAKIKKKSVSNGSQKSTGTKLKSRVTREDVIYKNIRDI